MTDDDHESGRCGSGRSAGRRWSPGETSRALVVVVGFSAALGATVLLFPLLALDQGITAATVGALTAWSAAVQLATRFALPALLSRYPDRSIIAVSAILLAASAGTLLVSTSFMAFVVAQSLQGCGRALFWTASQTHAVRASGTSVRRLAEVQLASKVGNLAGPSLAGVVAAASFRAALLATVVASLSASALGVTMARRPPYGSRGATFGRGLWRRPGIVLGMWTAFVAGGWRGLMDSFVPVVLSGAGFGSAMIGLLVSLSEGASLVANGWLARRRRNPSAQVLRAAALSVALGAGLLSYLGDHLVAVTIVVMVAGAGYGLAGTLGPAIANAHADAADQGNALAMAGAYRAGARLAAPGIVSVTTPVLGLPLSLIVIGAALGVPVLTMIQRLGRGARRDGLLEIEEGA